MTADDPTHGPLRTFGRIKARPIKPRQAALLDSLAPRIEIPAGPLDPRGIKPEASEIWLEIGFGGGEHMAGQAARRPDLLILGVEPFLNGVASALRHIDEAGLDNVRVRQGDAREVLADLAPASLDRIFILFPDPWPKTRHHKRRLVQTETLASMARALKAGGRLRLVTDWRDYAAWTLERMVRAPEFRWTAERAAHCRSAPDDHLTTRYETKALGDCKPIYLDFERV